MIPVRTLEDLGWPSLLAALAARARTERGRVAAEQLAFFEDPEHARARMAEIREALELGRIDATMRFGGITDVRPAIARAAKGGVLSPEELIAAGDTGRGLDRLRKQLRQHAGEAPRLAAIAGAIDDFGHMYHPILESFEPDGRLADHASDALGPLRRTLASLKQGLERRMHTLIDESRYADAMQDRYYTQRDDRYVVPVRVDARNQIRGIVHGTSQSGQTVFIEPDEIVDAGNRIILAECEVADEERRILAQLTGYVAEEAEALVRALDAAEHLDLVAASAALADDLEAHPAAIGDRGIELLRARHPLMVLSKGHCVPNDITLDRGVILIISGPNAGGKTVALKTTGLLSLMARAGLHLPAAPGSAIPWFRGIHSDIGDSQSLEHDLSTFSAHMVTLRAYLDESDRDTLLLIDEVAVGTEPEQGAALAQAVLEELAARGATAVVTTHYERLKVLGASGDRFANASVGFDLERMEPTFQLHVGVPGSSGALAVARRMGLAPGVVERAESLLGDRRAELEQLLAELAGERRQLELEREGAQRERAEAEAARRQAESARAAARERERKAREGAHDDAVAALREARSELERLRETVKRRKGERGLKDAARRVDSVASKVFEHAPEREPPPGKPARPDQLTPGTAVVVVSLGGRGEVVSAPDRNRVTVQIGPLRTTVPVRDVLLDLNPQPSRAPRASKPAPAPGPGAGMVTETPIRTPDITLDLRGERVHDAEGLLDRFLDQSLLAGRDVIFVIHGHGTGALRQAVRSHLAGHPVVTKWRAGEPGEGGDGVTLAWLDAV
jgi:DNA mismatch repair protein MutS2